MIQGQLNAFLLEKDYVRPTAELASFVEAELYIGNSIALAGAISNPNPMIGGVRAPPNCTLSSIAAHLFIKCIEIIIT